MLHIITFMMLKCILKTYENSDGNQKAFEIEQS